jgi:hypothetical protein
MEGIPSKRCLAPDLNGMTAMPAPTSNGAHEIEQVITMMTRCIMFLHARHILVTCHYIDSYNTVYNLIIMIKIVTSIYLIYYTFFKLYLFKYYNIQLYIKDIF